MSGLSAFRHREPGWFKIDSEQTKEVFIPAELHEMAREVVHSSPEDFRKNAICTWPEDGLCYACEQGTFQWTGRVKFYIPVIENNKTMIFVQGTGVNSLIWSLGEHFQETGTSVGWFEINRTGSGKRSKYIANPIDKQFPIRYNSNIDLRNHLKKIDYLDQKHYYS